MLKYFAEHHGDWLAIPFSSPLRNQLKVSTLNLSWWQPRTEESATPQSRIRTAQIRFDPTAYSFILVSANPPDELLTS